jgi:ribonuclease P protein component
MPEKNQRPPPDPDARKHTAHTFRKEERLSGRSLISSLFQEGRSVQTSVFTVFFKEAEGQGNPVRVAISVPRRLHRKAVDRNLLKRRIREAYRLYKPEFYERIQKTGKQVILVLIFRKREISDFRTIRTALLEALELIERKLKRTGHGPANT